MKWSPVLSSVLMSVLLTGCGSTVASTNSGRLTTSTCPQAGTRLPNLTLANAAPFLNATVAHCSTSDPSITSVILARWQINVSAEDGVALPGVYTTSVGKSACTLVGGASYLRLGGQWYRGRGVACATAD